MILSPVTSIEIILTRELKLLPDIDVLQKTWQSMAMLDAILSPKWQYRYYSFNAQWGPSMQFGSMRNGGGDHLFAQFSSSGCWIKGFAHEFPLPAQPGSSNGTRPGIYDSVPADFADCLLEPAYNIDEVSFCLWRRTDDGEWESVPADIRTGSAEEEGGGFLLSPFMGRAETYQAWAEDYHETEVSLAAVEHIFHHRPLTPEIVAQLNAGVEIAELREDAAEIGYPVS